MKKRILFIMNNLHCGGAEKALISLLQTINYSKFEVDLMLFKREGIFLSKLPKQVNLLDEPAEYQYFDMPIKKAIVGCIKTGRLDVVLARIKAGYIFKKEKNSVRCEQRVWKHLSSSLKKNVKQYDVAIGYLEKNPIYFCVDKVQAKKKIGFIHNDYKKLGMDLKIDRKYFKHLDSIVTVSEECAHVLKETFPMYKHKVEVMLNIVSPEVIKKMADDVQEIGFEGVNLVSIGRLHNQKGFDIAIRACKKIVNNGYQIKWYVVGEGLERRNLEKLIEENNLQEHFILLGLKENPYPYIKQADICVQPSRFEGKSIAIDEAKILSKPIVATNFSTVGDQLVHLQTGIIVEMNADSVADGIEKLINEKELRKKLSANLDKENLGTESEIQKLYALFKTG